MRVGRRGVAVLASHGARGGVTVEAYIAEISLSFCAKKQANNRKAYRDKYVRANALLRSALLLKTLWTLAS